MLVVALFSLFSSHLQRTNSTAFAAFGVRIDSSSEDDVGKTVAIIVGVLAGLSILIVFLSFCRRAMGRNFSANLCYF